MIVIDLSTEDISDSNHLQNYSMKSERLGVLETAENHPVKSIINCPIQPGNSRDNCISLAADDISETRSFSSCHEIENMSNREDSNDRNNDSNNDSDSDSDSGSCSSSDSESDSNSNSFDSIHSNGGIAYPNKTISKSDNRLSSMEGSFIEQSTCNTIDRKMSMNTPNSLETNAKRPPSNFKPIVRLRDSNNLVVANERDRLLGSTVTTQESYEQWRERIWPAKAYYLFARTISRCRPINVTSPFLSVEESSDKTDRIQLERHWDLSLLDKVKSSYSSVGSHNMTYFMLLMEQCRVAIVHELDEECRSVNLRYQWLPAEILRLNSESDKSLLPQPSCEPKSSTVWGVHISITSCVTKHPSFEDSEFSSGDVVLVMASNWNRPIIGIVHGWDPDYDMKHINIVTTTTRKRSDSCISNSSGDQGVITTQELKLLICIDENNESDEMKLGGWATHDMLFSGLQISVTTIGNALTSIRECQAIMSMKCLRKSFQEVLLKGNTLSDSFSSSDRSRIAPSPFELASNGMWKKFQSNYNSSQLQAIKCVIDTVENRKDSGITLLQGPPGTGKTNVCLAIIGVLLCSESIISLKKPGSNIIAGNTLKQPEINVSKKKRRVLVCAPSNTAVDELVYRLQTQGVLDSDGNHRSDLNVVRVGHIGGSKRTDDSILGFQRKSAKVVYNTNISNVVERTSLDLLVEEKRKLLISSNEKTMSNLDIRKGILDAADVVCCTLSGAGSQALIEVILRITNFKFDSVIIDEAAQASEPLSLIPFKFDPSIVVMVGDPAQLPSVVFSKSAKELNYEQSLFQRLQLGGHPIIMLETQYRMHKEICAYPSKRFYGDKLVTADCVINSNSHVQLYHSHPSGMFRPFVFHDCCKSSERFEGTSISNLEEALYIVELYQELAHLYPDYAHNIGIIAPYSAQRKILKAMFQEKCFHSKADIEISTVDGFQGREKDIIIFSCVRASSKSRNNTDTSSNSTQQPFSGIGFLRERQRLNVALTRAKYAVWIVGHGDTLNNDSEWRQLIKYCTDNNCLYKSHEKKKRTHINNEDKLTDPNSLRKRFNNRNFSINDPQTRYSYHDSNNYRNRNFYQNRNIHPVNTSYVNQNSGYGNYSRPANTNSYYSRHDQPQESVTGISSHDYSNRQQQSSTNDRRVYQNYNHTNYRNNGYPPVAGHYQR